MFLEMVISRNLHIFVKYKIYYLRIQFVIIDFTAQPIYPSYNKNKRRSI
jgi:hypothetical protein